MADKPTDEPVAPVFTETLPSQVGKISAIASANAPFIYLDGAPNFGFNDGIINVTLEAIRFQPGGGQVVDDRVIVAHLRMGLQAAARLRDSINAALTMAAPPKPEEVN